MNQRKRGEKGSTLLSDRSGHMAKLATIIVLAVVAFGLVYRGALGRGTPQAAT